MDISLYVASVMRLLALAVLGVLAAAGVSRAATATAPASDSCGTAQIDFKGQASFERNHLLVHGVTITLTEADCKVSVTISADVAEAGGKSFGNDDTWSVSGQVVINVPEGELRADSAQVTLVGGVMKMATVRGAPATFVRASVPGEASVSGARGQAAVIAYNASSGDLELLGDSRGNARLQDDSGQLDHQRIVYNLRQRTVQAGSSDPSARGSITIKRPPKALP